jgi:hypothetical protein
LTKKESGEDEGDNIGDRELGERDRVEAAEQEA